MRSSERAPAGTPSGDADVAGGWPPSLTFALGNMTRTQMSKPLGIVAALVLPFLLVLAVGVAFDKKTGDDPFYATSFYLFFLSPLWLLIGIVWAVIGFKRERFRRGLFIADGILSLFIIVGVAAVRAIYGY
jgi:hypothetical protein